ncbi:MAG: hypothetical protein ACI8S6_004428 [Myxococcota bacterium]|jgi:uncharacterized protein involved in response to NO
MMARVGLGHTGRPLQVGAAMTTSFIAVGLAAAARALGPWLDPARASVWWWGAAALWSLGFLIFVVMYARIFVTPRADGQAG